MINVELNEGLERIELVAFNGCRSLTSINIPSTIKMIGWRAFDDCEQLVNVELPEGLERIDSGAFCHCISLQRINIPSTVKRIGGYAFQGCRQLRSVELHEGLKHIHDTAFQGCALLERIRIPSSVNYIAENAFNYCNNLVAIEFCNEIEQFVDEVSLPWWNHGVSEVSLRTYSFLVEGNILARLGTIKVKVWKKNIHNLLQRIPEELKDVDNDDDSYNPSTYNEEEEEEVKQEEDVYLDSIRSRLSNYEYLQTVAPFLELALWKLHMEVSNLMKLQCRYNSLTMIPIIIPNVLSFL